MSEEHPTNTLATVSVVLGAAGLVGAACCCVPILNYIAMALVPLLDIAAIVTGVVALKKANELDGLGAGKAKLGIGLGAGSILMGVILFALLIVFGLGVGLMGGSAATLMETAEMQQHQLVAEHAERDAELQRLTGEVPRMVQEMTNSDGPKAYRKCIEKKPGDWGVSGGEEDWPKDCSMYTIDRYGTFE